MIEVYANAVHMRLLHCPDEIRTRLHQLLSYHVEGAEQTDAFKSGGWNGRKSFFNLKTDSCPAGFLRLVQQELDDKGAHFKVKRVAAPEPIGMSLEEAQKRTGFKYDPRYDYQWNAVKALLNLKQMIAMLSTGCHAKGQKVLLHNGYAVNVEDVKVGDKLLGPDSEPRTVLNLCRGKGKMYKIIPVKGESFIVNEDHILSLEVTNVGDKNITIFDKNRNIIRKVRAYERFNISVGDYIAQTRSTKHVLKLWRTGVDFPERDLDPNLPPYILGAWLGDGDSKFFGITTADYEVFEEFSNHIESTGLNLRTEVTLAKNGNPNILYRCVASGHQNGKDKDYLHRRENWLKKSLAEFDLLNNKHIPDIYKFNSFENRVELLAGILDTDGYLDHGYFDIVVKQEVFARDIAFLARSLGLAAYIKKCTKSIKSINFKGQYWRVTISGDIDIIPCRLERRKPAERKQIKRVNVTGFKVEQVEDDDFYGFTLDKDHLYLLDDFTVTHNSGKSNCASLAYFVIGRPTIFVTTRAALAHQMKGTLEKYGEKVGIIGDGFWEPNINGFTVCISQTIAPRLQLFDKKAAEHDLTHVEAKDHKGKTLINNKGEKVYIKSPTYQEAAKDRTKWKQYINDLDHRLIQLEKAHIQRRQESLDVLAKFEFAILEEAHESSADGYFRVMSALKNANWRLALTATPFLKDTEADNMRLMACSGPIGIKVGERELIDKGILAKPYFKFIEINQAPSELKQKTSWQKAYKLGIVENHYRNQIIVEEAQKAASHGLSVLILVTQQNHGKMLAKMLGTQFLSGTDDQTARQNALDQLRDKKTSILVASSILDVGVDVASLGMVILAGGGKAQVNLRQRIGRGLRAKKQGPNVTFIIDFIDTQNQYTNRHSKKRLSVIKNIDGFKQGIVKELPYEEYFK